MNTARAVELARRQQALLDRSERLREQLVSDLGAWQAPLAAADAVVGAWRWARAHPHVLAVAAATLGLVFALRRPRRVLGFGLRWVPRAWAAWRAWRRLLDAAAPRPLTRR